MTNNCKIIVRNFKKIPTGPMEIIEHLLIEYNAEIVEFEKIQSSLTHFRKLNYNNSVIVFTPFSFKLLLLGRVDLIGYDSFARMNLLRKDYLRAALYFCIELISYNWFKGIYLVNPYDIKFARNFYRKKSNNLHYLDFDSNKNLISKKLMKIKGFLILGNYNRKEDLLDLKKNLKILSESGVKKITIHGANAENAFLSVKDLFKEMDIEIIEWVQSFEDYYRNKNLVVIFNSRKASGLITRIRKVHDLGNLVLTSKKIWLGYEKRINHFSWETENEFQIILQDLLQRT